MGLGNFLMTRKAGIKLVNIYAFVGVMGSGKGYKCNKLKEKGYIQIDFADCLRNMVWKMLDWKPKNAEEYDLFKKGKMNVPKYGYLNGRVILQGLGTETMRKADPDFWAKCWLNEVDRAISMGYTNICCSDVRYPNEIKALRKMSNRARVRIEFCDYHSDRYNNTCEHDSEKMAREFLKQGYKDGELIYG